MPLESLHTLVETLRERIQAHGDALRGSEALTRYALIDPLLRELGWDTADPALVVPEYVLSKYGSGNAKRADYALLSQDIPVMMVEAKSLGSSLRDEALSQGIQYCLEKGTKFFALTDGSSWEIYETHQAVPIEEKRIVAFDVCSKATAEVCLQALSLWRPSLEVGRATAGQAPVIQTEPVPAKYEIRPASVEALPNPTDESLWQPLSTLKPASGTNPPKGIGFPDNSSQPIEHWKGIIIETIRWLANERLLKASDCPIPYSSRSKKYIVATVPVHPSDKDFRNPREVNAKNVGKLFVETHSSANDCVKKAITIIEHVGQAPSQFKVRFE